MRLVANNTIQFFVVFVLDSIDCIGTCNLVLKAHDSSNDAGDSEAVAQNREFFPSIDGKSDSTSSPLAEPFVIHVDKLGLLKVGPNPVCIRRLCLNISHALKFFDMQEEVRFLAVLIFFEMQFLVHHDLPISVLVFLQIFEKAAAAISCTSTHLKTDAGGDKPGKTQDYQGW